MDDRRIESALKADLSQGTEEFREELLGRCLDVLGSDERELSESDLDLLSAAGVVDLAWRPPMRDNIV